MRGCCWCGSAPGAYRWYFLFVFLLILCGSNIKSVNITFNLFIWYWSKWTVRISFDQLIWCLIQRTVNVNVTIDFLYEQLQPIKDLHRKVNAAICSSQDQEWDGGCNTCLDLNLFNFICFCLFLGSMLPQYMALFVRSFRVSRKISFPACFLVRFAAFFQSV